MNSEQLSDDSAGMARYTHGHSAPVLSAHSRRGAEDSAAYLLPHLNAGMDLLDVGCGPATITADLADRVTPGRVVGLDAASGALEAARATLAERDLPARVELTDGDVMSLPFDDGTFDVAHAHGLELVYHHHLGTVIQTKEETIRLMELTDPAKVSLLFDTGHAYVGDGDVMGLLEATIDRIKHVHFKDVRPEKMAESKAAERSFLDSFLAGMFTVPGDGTIDFTVPYKFLVDHGYRNWILVEAEQDPAIANPLEYARKARAYLEGTLFKA